MNTIEAAVIIVFIVAIAAVTIVFFRRTPKETSTPLPVAATATPPGEMWKTTVQTTPAVDGDGKPLDRVLFSADRGEARVVEEALRKHREAKGEAEAKSGLYTKSEPQPKNGSHPFDRRMMAAVPVGIRSLEDKLIEAAEKGDTKALKEGFVALDWMEDLAERVFSDAEEDVDV